MSAIGAALGAAGGAAATIRALLVIDTSGVRKDMKKGEDEAAKGKEPAEKQRQSKLDAAAKAAFVVSVAFKAAKKLIDGVAESVHRLAELRGIGDPITGSFLRLEASVTKLWDSFVLGTLKSQTVQAALAYVSDGMVALAKQATGLGGAIDTWAKENAKGVATFAGVLGGAYAYVKDWFSTTYNTFKLIASGIAYVAGAVVKFMGSLASGLSSVLDAVGMDKASKSIKGLSRDWESLGEALKGEGGKGANEALEGLASNFEDIWESAGRASAAAEKFLGSMTPRDTTSNSLREPSQELRALHDRFAGVVGQIGDAWQDGLDRMSGAFGDWAADARKQAEDGSAQVYEGTQSLLSGFSAMGRQAEQAFGKSSTAAKIFVKAQLAMQAILAGVQGFMEFGKASAEQTDNPGAAAQHLAAGGLFFTAAGLAGAQFAGLIGGGRGGGSSRGQNALDTRASAADSVDRQPVVVMLNVQGNVLGNEEYLKDELIPRMRRLVEDQGVTFVASDLANNGRV